MFVYIFLNSDQSHACFYFSADPKWRMAPKNFVFFIFYRNSTLYKLYKGINIVPVSSPFIVLLAFSGKYPPSPRLCFLDQNFLGQLTPPVPQSPISVQGQVIPPLPPHDFRLCNPPPHNILNWTALRHFFRYLKKHGYFSHGRENFRPINLMANDITWLNQL